MLKSTFLKSEKTVEETEGNNEAYQDHLSPKQIIEVDYMNKKFANLRLNQENPFDIEEFKRNKEFWS